MILIDGEERKYEMVSRTGNLIPETKGEKVNAVMIVPLVGEKLMLSREFIIPVNRWIYNFPAGLICYLLWVIRNLQTYHD